MTNPAQPNNSNFMKLFHDILLATLTAFSCTCEVSVQLPGPVVQEGQLSRKIILPPNTKSDTTGLVVLSGAGSSIPVAPQFAADTSSKNFRTAFDG